MFLRTLVVVACTLGALTRAAVKRDDYGASSAGGSSQPVYSPSSGSSSYGSSSGTGYGAASSGGSYGSGSSAGSSNYEAAASNTNYQTQPSSQGNLYYYYYPVQEKVKDTNYAASSSNTYTSAVTPNFGGSASSSSIPTSTSAFDTTDGGQDLSYGTQDITYAAQSLPSYGTHVASSSLGSSYDQLASQLAAASAAGYGTLGSTGGASSYGGLAANNAYGLGSAGAYGLGSSPVAAYGADPSSYVATHGASYAASPYGSSGQSPYAVSSGSYSLPSQSHYAPSPAAALAHYPGYSGTAQASNYGLAQGTYATSASENSNSYRRYGLGSLIMPMLALAGLSLLIPTVTNLSSGRKKRSAEDSAKASVFGSYLDRLERYYSIYRSAVEKEECMNRVICELGDAMSGVRGKAAVVSVLEKVVPNWMGNKIGVFKSAALSGDVAKCKKYQC